MSCPQGDIFVNGHYLQDLQQWYKQNTGYVLQLATPYYDEMTVKENLLYSAMMRVPAGTPRKEIFERVEVVMREVGLFESADTIVGGSVGGGLSGGQVRIIPVMQYYDVDLNSSVSPCPFGVLQPD